MEIYWFIAGNKASIPELVDFIFAAQIAKVMKKEEAEEDDITCYVREKEVYILDSINEIFQEMFTMLL